jgi:hypothetical protein
LDFVPSSAHAVRTILCAIVTCNKAILHLAGNSDLLIAN